MKKFDFAFRNKFEPILLDNMRLFLRKRDNFLPSVDSSNFQDGGPCHVVAKCMMGQELEMHCGVKNQCDCMGKTQNN